MPAPEHSDDERERCVTGIDAIDHILNGGVPRGNTVLISGSVGTGKTSICIEFLVRGALNGENSLYLSVTEPTDKLLMNVIPFDFFEHSDDERERCVTGIDAIDHILNGGVPRGNTVLISGSVGTGKTSICIEFLVRGALNGENSLYLSVTEPTDKLLMNVIPFDFFDDKLVRQGKLQFVDLPKIYDKLGIDKEDLDFDQTRLLADTIAGIVEEQKIRRLVLDSVTSVCYRIREQERIRDFLLRLGTVLSAKGCTTLLVSEIRSSEDGYSQWGVEDRKSTRLN